jgi:hypothetical protein
MHLHEENPDCIDKCVKLYSEDAVWQRRPAASLLPDERRSRVRTRAYSVPRRKSCQLRTR